MKLSVVADPATSTETLGSIEQSRGHVRPLHIDPAKGNHDFSQLARQLRTTVATAFTKVSSVEDSVAGVVERVRRLEASAVRSRPATEGERAAWADYLRNAVVALPAAQGAMVLDLWQRLIEHEPAVMYPTCGLSEDGSYYLGWNPGRATLDLEVSASGDVSWFFADHKTGLSASSDDGSGEGYLTFVELFRRR
jgi:hypothetical protein